MTCRSRRLLAAGLAVLMLQACAAGTRAEDAPPQRKAPATDRSPDIPPPPCSDIDPTIPATCGRDQRPHCCCIGYDKPGPCPKIWPELTPPHRDPRVPGPGAAPSATGPAQ